MKKSISGIKNKRGVGRPSTGIGPNVGLRLYPDLADALNDWIADQPDPKLSVPEAIRRLLRQALGLGN